MNYKAARRTLPSMVDGVATATAGAMLRGRWITLALLMAAPFLWWKAGVPRWMVLSLSMMTVPFACGALGGALLTRFVRGGVYSAVLAVLLAAHWIVVWMGLPVPESFVLVAMSSGGAAIACAWKAGGRRWALATAVLLVGVTTPAGVRASALTSAPIALLLLGAFGWPRSAAVLAAAALLYFAAWVPRSIPAFGVACVVILAGRVVAILLDPELTRESVAETRSRALLRFLVAPVGTTLCGVALAVLFQLSMASLLFDRSAWKPWEASTAKAVLGTLHLLTPVVGATLFFHVWKGVREVSLQMLSLGLLLTVAAIGNVTAQSEGIEPFVRYGLFNDAWRRPVRPDAVAFLAALFPWAWTILCGQFGRYGRTNGLIDGGVAFLPALFLLWAVQAGWYEGHEYLATLVQLLLPVALFRLIRVDRPRWGWVIGAYAIAVLWTIVEPWWWPMRPPPTTWVVALVPPLVLWWTVRVGRNLGGMTAVPMNHPIYTDWDVAGRGG